MPSFRKACVLFGCAALSVAAVAQKPDAKESGDAKKKKTDASESGKTSDGEKKKPEPMPFPLPIGHGGKGLRIPYLEGDAQKSMQFVVGKAKRTKEDVVTMSDLKIEILAQDDAPEMKVNLPSATMNLVTRVITGDKAVKVQRDDFLLTGDRLKFDTVTKQGKLEGHVRMLIYNLANELPSSAQPAPKAKDRE
jgi:hypothetical protein